MDFSELLFDVKVIEKAASAAAKEKTQVAAIEISLPKTIDFSPEEFIDKDYLALINDYERMIKIARTSGIKFQQVAGRVEVAESPQKKFPIYVLAGEEQAAKAAAPQKKAVPAAPAQPKKGFQFPVLGLGKPGVKPEAKPETPKSVVAPQPKLSIAVAQPPPAPEAPPEKEEAPEEKELELEFEREGAKSERAKPTITEEKQHELRERISELMEKTLEQEKPKAAPEAKSVEHEFEFEPAEELMKQQIEKKKGEALASGKSEQQAIEEVESVFEEGEKPFSQEAKEAFGEISEIPYLAKHENVSIVVPPILSMSPKDEAERRLSEIESKIPEAGTSASKTEIKKRMIELTKELFKEKSSNRRAEIKNELGALREALSAKEKETTATRVVSYATSFLNLLEASSKAEISDAKESIIRTYREQLVKILSLFSSSFKLAKALDEKQKICDLFSTDMEALKSQIQQLAEKYEAFFLREHTVSLEKVRSIASMKNDKNSVEKIDEKLGEIKFTYASEFAALENSVNREISAFTELKLREALGETGDVDVDKALAILEKNDDEVIQYVHSRQPERYAEFELGKINRLELIAAGRALIAAEEGLKKDTINKYFGSFR